MIMIIIIVLRLNNKGGNPKVNNVIEEKEQIAKVVRERRSIRSFTDKPIEKQLIFDLLNDAVWAPNHGLREPWRFILVHGEGTKKLDPLANVIIDGLIQDPTEKEKALRKIQQGLREIPAHLLVVMKEDTRQKQWEEDFAATCALIQNFQLLAWVQGLGVVWKTGEYMYMPAFKEFFNVLPDEKIVGILHLGYPKVIPKPSTRTPANKKLTIIE